jgi:D-tyrosyl-tRNA(Tyr) deacylase
MRVLLQKVTKAAVSVDGQTVGAIDAGYLLFLGVLRGDTAAEAQWLAHKITQLRLFPGEDGTINDRSLLQVNGGALVVSQFTLAGRTEKGNRPDYTQAAPPAEANELYEQFAAALRTAGISPVATGRFGATMEVSLTNDGPVTLLLERVSGEITASSEDSVTGV